MKLGENLKGSIQSVIEKEIRYDGHGLYTVLQNTVDRPAYDPLFELLWDRVDFQKFDKL